MDQDEFRSTILLEIYSSARKHGVADEDIEHAVQNAMAIESRGRDRILWVGPARSGALLEVITVQMRDGRDVAIHAMRLRAKYKRLLSRGD